MFQSNLDKQNKIIADYKQAIDKHQEDVKKAIKIHKANERLAQQNVGLKKELERFQSGNLTTSPVLINQINDPSNQTEAVKPDWKQKTDEQKWDGNKFCLKVLIEKQELETQVVSLREQVEDLTKQLSDAKTAQESNNINIQDNREFEELEDKLEKATCKPQFTK